MAQVKMYSKKDKRFVPAHRVMTSARNARLSLIATKPKTMRRNSYGKRK